MGAPQKVKDYYLAYPDKPRPPVRLEAWLGAYRAEKQLEIIEEDNKAMSKLAQGKQRRRR